MSITKKAVDFALSAWNEELPESVISISKRALIDYVAVAISGSQEPVSQKIQTCVRSQSVISESKVFGVDLVVSRNFADLANGVAAHAQDLMM